MKSSTSPDRPSRRQFLATIAAGAAAGIVPMGNAAATPGKKVRLGIAGGRFGATFHWHEHPQCEVAAVTDLIPERRAHLVKTYRCDKSYASLEEMVKDPNLDAIAVFTDGPKHYEHAVLALKHGKHVISAVPAVMAATVAEALDQANSLEETARKSGLTYMMAETSYYQDFTISARKFHEDGTLGSLVSCESEYLHPGLRVLYGSAEKPTWRYGVPPMFYPTHCTAHLVSVTGERLVEVTCSGWGNDHPVCKKNAFGNNPFWNETAHFRSDRGTPFPVRIWWEGPVWGRESANWYGTKMSFAASPGQGHVIWQPGKEQGHDDAGFPLVAAKSTPYEQPEWWKTDLLPEPLRHNSGHHGSHTFLTHEFIDALANARRPTVDLYEALAYTVPGIIAHQSALKGGESLKIPQFTRPA
jgi:predicted dehydrogenase